MTDERYVFNQDVAERSKMKTGAFHKKNGSKSKRCTLPSDHLTPAQKKKLSGPCFSINMNEPLHDWKKFRSLPKTMQVNYINGLVNNYGARQRDIADMFGVKPGTFSQYCCAKFKSETLFKKGGTGKTMDERFLDFLTKPEKKEDAEVVQRTEAQTVKEREFEPTQSKTDDEILKERFEIETRKEPPKTGNSDILLIPEGNETIAKQTHIRPVSEYAHIFNTEEKPEKKPAFMFSALVDAQMNLSGSRDEILNALGSLLNDDGIVYKLSFQLSIADIGLFAKVQDP